MSIVPVRNPGPHFLTKSTLSSSLKPLATRQNDLNLAGFVEVSCRPERILSHGS